MALGSKDPPTEKAATLEKMSTLEKIPRLERVAQFERPARLEKTPTLEKVSPASREERDVEVEAGASSSCRSCCSLSRVLLLLTMAACCLCLGFVELHRLRHSAEVQKQLLVLQRRLDLLESAAESSATAEEQGPVRARRSIEDPLRTVDGVPIIARPYGSRRRPPSEGLRIYETFMADREAQPTAASVNYETDDPSIQPHHRSSASFRTLGRFGRVNTNTVIADGERPTGAASGPLPSRLAPGELHRRSRVSQTPGRRGQVGPPRVPPGPREVSAAGPRQAAPILEARGSPPAFVPPPAGAGARSGHRHAGQQRCAAAHFEGSVSPLSRRSTSYGGSKGNGRLRNTNQDAMFVDWQPAEWMERDRCSEDFKLYGGQVTVRHAGLYYLYAQINYLEDSDINGFEIQVNARSFIKCLTMEASEEREKANTCYTGAVTYLRPGDAVSIRDLEPGRTSVLLPDRSFFGLIRLSSSG